MTKLSKLGILALKVALLGYSGLRNWHFLSLTIGAGEHWALPYLGLAALEGGAVLWDLYRRHGDDGAWPRGIALSMTIVCLAGLLVGVGADTQLGAGASGLVTVAPELAEYTIAAVWAVIGLNVIALVAVANMTTQQREKDAEFRQLEADEQAAELIEREALKLIRREAKAVAAQLAPLYAQNFVTRMNTLHRERLGLKAGQALPSATTVAAEPHPLELPALVTTNGNGKHPKA